MAVLLLHGMLAMWKAFRSTAMSRGSYWSCWHGRLNADESERSAFGSSYREEGQQIAKGLCCRMTIVYFWMKGRLILILITLNFALIRCATFSIPITVVPETTRTYVICNEEHNFPSPMHDKPVCSFGALRSRGPWTENAGRNETTSLGNLHPLLLLCGPIISQWPHKKQISLNFLRVYCYHEWYCKNWLDISPSSL